MLRIEHDPENAPLRCLSLSLRSRAWRKFLALGDRKRAGRPHRELVGIVIEPLRQPPIGERGAADAARTLGAGVDKRLGAFALKIRNACLVHLEIDRAVEYEREHQTFAENAGAAEHAPHSHRTKRREQLADEFGVQAAALRRSNSSYRSADRAAAKS